MTTKKIIAADAPKTFAEVIVKLENLEGLSKTRRRDLISAMNAMARFLDKPTDQLEANINLLRQRLRQFHPRQARVSEKTYANVKSAVLSALKLTGANNKRAAGSPPMSEGFQILYDAIPDQLIGYKLSRLFRYCSEEGLRPDQITDATIAAFEAHVIGQTLHRDPGKVVREAVLTWNKLREQVESWPDIILHRAPARIPWTYPLEQFPQSFQQDVDAWFARMAMTDLFDDDAPVRALRPATITHRRFQVRMMASAIVLQGVPIDRITSLADLVDIENFRSGIQFLLDREDGVVKEALFTLATGIKSIARYHVKVSESDLERLKRLCSRLDQQADRYRKKNKDRLAQFDDRRNMGALLGLPDRLMEKSRSPGPKPRSAALLAQSAAVLEILLMCAPRIGNVASLDLDRHLRWIMEGKVERLMISIPGHEVKNGKPLLFELTGPSAEILRSYIEIARPQLLDQPGTALFPKRKGGPKLPGDLSQQIKSHIFAETGLIVNSHLFRSLASKIHNLVCAGDAATISHVLGDRMETVMKAYSQFEQKAALEFYQFSVNNVRTDHLQRGA
jgi:integrase